MLLHCADPKRLDTWRLIETPLLCIDVQSAFSAVLERQLSGSSAAEKSSSNTSQREEEERRFNRMMNHMEESSSMYLRQ
jgi:hypothetical protein